MTRLLLASLFVAGCVHGLPVLEPASALAPLLVIESPRPNALVREPEVDVSGRFVTYDGRAWVHADATQAETKGGRFAARHVPLHDGKATIFVDLTDGRGQKVHTGLPLIVETPDRPRPGVLCRPALGCVRFEERGLPIRDAADHIANAAIVVVAFGFDERLDELWPDLVGPGRALDPRERYILGVAGAQDDVGRRPGPDAIVSLLDELVRDRALDRGAALIGASSYGSELVLRSLARGLTTGPIMLCGGHDRPYEEPAMQAVQATLQRVVTQAPNAAWLELARVIVPVSYGPGYLAQLGHASTHGLVAEANAHGLEAALVEQLAAHFAGALSVVELARRMDAAFELREKPLVYPAIKGRHIVLVANTEDQMMSVSRMRALALRLRSAGAQVTTHALSDPLGQNVFFHRVPLELETAARELFVAAP